MNLEQIIDQWIGEEVPFKVSENMEARETYNDTIKYLKSRKQELIEGIVGVIEKHKLPEDMELEVNGEFVKVSDWEEENWIINQHIDKIIKELTGK